MIVLIVLLIEFLFMRKEELKRRVEALRNERMPKANTALRVGGLLQDILEWVQERLDDGELRDELARLDKMVCGDDENGHRYEELPFGGSVVGQLEDVLTNIDLLEKRVGLIVANNNNELMQKIDALPDLATAERAIYVAKGNGYLALVWKRVSGNNVTVSLHSAGEAFWRFYKIDNGTPRPDGDWREMAEFVDNNLMSFVEELHVLFGPKRNNVFHFVEGLKALATSTTAGLMSATDKSALDGLSQTLGKTVAYLGTLATPTDFYRAVENHPSFKGRTTCIYAASISENNSNGITFILKNSGVDWITMYLFENHYINKMVIEYTDKTRTRERWRSGWRDMLAHRLEWRGGERTLRLHNTNGFHGSHTDVQIPLASDTVAGLAPAGYIPRWEKIRTTRNGSSVHGYFDGRPPEIGDLICLRGLPNSMQWRFTFEKEGGYTSRVEFNASTEHNNCVVPVSGIESTAVRADDVPSGESVQFWIMRMFPPHP